MSDRDAPLVSVIIPCYNTERFVAETMRSVIAQTYKNLEIIVVDDGSTDGSEREIHAVKDPRIIRVYQENQGLSAARNTGIRTASGAYLMFLDADDLIFPEKIQTQVAWLEKNPEFSIVACGFDRTDERGKKLYSVNPVEKEITTADLLSESQFPVHTALLRREIAERVGFFDTTLRAAEDWDYWCRCSKAGAKIYRLQQSLCTYRLLDNAMTANAPRQTEMLLRVAEKNFTDSVLSTETKILQSRSLEKILLTGAARCLVLEFYEAGAEYLRRAIKLSPQIIRYDYDIPAGKIAGMCVHLNVQNTAAKAENIFDNLRKEISLPSDFAEKIIYRTELLRARSPLKYVLSHPAGLKFGLQLLAGKILND